MGLTRLSQQPLFLGMPFCGFLASSRTTLHLLRRVFRFALTFRFEILRLDVVFLFLILRPRFPPSIPDVGLAWKSKLG